MEKGEKFQRKKIEIGKIRYLNENCWLVKILNYAPYKRCQYCGLNFRNCLFLHYQIISSILILFFLILSFLIEGENSKLVIISVFTLVIVYGYFFNKSTDKIIQANFAQRKANETLEELTENLQQKVDEQTKELKEAYQIEKKAHQELKKLDEAKTQFIMATQHHLRTPLTIMKGYISMLLEGDYGKLNKKAREKLLFFQQSTEKLINLVNDFLDISQFKVGKGILNLQKVKVEDLVREIIKELKPEAENKEIYLKLEKPASLPFVQVDPSKFKEAIYNIIDNGVKYTEKGGVTINIKRQKAGTILIVVKDTGIGMSKEELDGLFKETFERSKGAKKLYALGRGIGLYIASNIIKAHRSKIWAESPGKGKGSTFYIELPVK